MKKNRKVAAGKRRLKYNPVFHPQLPLLNEFNKHFNHGALLTSSAGFLACV